MNAPGISLSLEVQQIELTDCAWDGQSMAPSSGEPYECHEEVTVFHLGAESPFCTHHFQLFDKAFGWQFPWTPEPQLDGNCIEGLIQAVAHVEQRIGAQL